MSKNNRSDGTDQSVTTLAVVQRPHSASRPLNH